MQPAYTTKTIRANADTAVRERVRVQIGVTREWVTYKQAEEIAGLSRTTLRKLVEERTIKVKRVGRAVRINRESLDAYMDDDAPGKE